MPKAMKRDLWGGAIPVEKIRRAEFGIQLSSSEVCGFRV
jgi:hypothetical protein